MNAVKLDARHASAQMNLGVILHMQVGSFPQSSHRFVVSLEYITFVTQRRASQVHDVVGDKVNVCKGDLGPSHMIQE